MKKELFNITGRPIHSNITLENGEIVTIEHIKNVIKGVYKRDLGIANQKNIQIVIYQL